MPCQELATACGKPASPMVGTSGMAATRSFAVTASALSRPPFTCGMVEAMVPNMISTWPPTTSVAAGPAPPL